MRGELRDQVLPTYTAWVASEALKELRLTGTVRDYIKQWFNLEESCERLVEVTKAAARVSAGIPRGPKVLLGPRMDQRRAVESVGHNVGKVRVGKSRFQLGVDWLKASTVVRVWSFQKLANYFRKYVRDYTNELLRRCRRVLYPFVYGERQQHMHEAWIIQGGVHPWRGMEVPDVRSGHWLMKTTDKAQGYSLHLEYHQTGMRCRREISFFLGREEMSSTGSVGDRVWKLVVFMEYPPPCSTKDTREQILRADGVSDKSGVRVSLTVFGLQRGKSKLLHSNLSRQPLDEVSSCWKSSQQCFTRRWRKPIEVLESLATLQSLEGGACSQQLSERQGVVSPSFMMNWEAKVHSRWSV